MPGETIVTVLENVLVVPDVALDRHIVMYQALAQSFRPIVFTTWSRDEAKRVMKLHHIPYDVLMDKGSSVLTDVDWKLSQMREMLSGWPVGLYLDADPEAVRRVLAMGISTLLLSHKVLRPAWLPSAGAPRAWDDLVSFLDAQHARDADLADEAVQSTKWGSNQAQPISTPRAQA